MWPPVVVDGSPVSDDRLRLEHGVECLDREHFVADAGAERLHERVLPRRAALDEAEAGRAVNGSHPAVSILVIGDSSLGLPGSAPIILVFFDKTPRYSTTQRAPA